MNKVFGTKECFVPLREDASRIIISYGYAEEADGENATWWEIYVNKKERSRLSFTEVRDAIIKDIDARTDEKSVYGWTWQDKPVWLTEQNKFNFKAVHDAAAMYPGQVTFPQLFKISEDSEHNAVYHQFETMEELAQFYLGGLAWIDQCVREGFQQKDGFDFTPYEQALEHGVQGVQGE